MQRRLLMVQIFLGSLSCTPMPPNDPIPHSEEVIADFAFLENDSLVILTSASRLLRSQDNGLGWDEIQMFCPSSEECPKINNLTPGTSGSIWASWVDHDLSNNGLMISRDAGETFSIIAHVPSGLIENPGSDPFLISHDGQLWQENPDSSQETVSFSKLGIPNPDGAVFGGPSVYCMDRFYVSGVDSRRASRVWNSSDRGNTWESDVESFFYPPALACGAGEHMWLVMDRTVLYYDFASATWNGVGNLEDVCGKSPCVSWLAANADFLYIAGRDVEDKPYIAEVFPFVGPVADLNIPTLPLPDPADDPYFSYRLKVSPGGDLWASGAGLYRFNRDSWNWTRVWP